MACAANLESLSKPARTEHQDQRQQSGDVIDVGDFHIDLSARTATVRGRELRLSSEEFDLLMFLTSHPRKLVTASTLLSTNWKGQGVRRAGFVHVLLSLRRKLER